MVKKPRHIWYFILTTGVVNMVFVYLVYYGFMALISDGITHFIENYGAVFYLTWLVIGLLLLFFTVRNMIRSTKKKKHAIGASATKENDLIFKVKSVSPLALIVVGIVSTVSELTSAVPYFSFLAVLVNYKLSFIDVTAVLVFYNIIYMFPFMLMYIIYIASKKWFDKAYDFFRKHLGRFLEIGISILFIALALVIMYASIMKLISCI